MAIELLSPTAPPSAPLSPLQRRIAWSLWLGGGWLRLFWIIVAHPPVHHIYSDMAGYIDRARRFWTQPETIADTIYPPGTYALFGALYRIDTALNLAALVQWLLSLATMGLVWLIARRLYGNTVGLVALALATLYLPFVHYASLFLAETPFTAAMLLSMWLLLRALDAAGTRQMLWRGALAGAAFGLAASFKNTNFVPFLLVGLYLALTRTLRRERWWPLAAGALAGAAVLFVPMAQRCTALNDGHFCLSANNIAMNMLMGHYGRNGPYHWHDELRHIDFEFQSPSTSIRGYTNKVQLAFGAYDNAANLAATLDWVQAHPAEALRLSVDNLGDLLFSPSLWPPFRLFALDLGALSQQLYWFLILLPAAALLLARLPAMLRLQAATDAEWLLLLPLLGLMATVFISIGEPRHRVPFDAFMIVLAAQALSRVASRLAGRA